MSFSYNLGANPQIDYPRMLVADTVDAGHIFEDEEIRSAGVIETFAIISPSGGGQSSSMGTPSPRYVAATLLEMIASNKARLATIAGLLDVKLNHNLAAQELRAQAEALRNAERNSGAFAIVEQCPDQFTMRERLWKQMLRLQS